MHENAPSISDQSIVIDRGTHTNTDSHDTISNITNVFVGKSEIEHTLPARKEEYKNLCREKIKNGLIPVKARLELDARAHELELTDQQKREVEEYVRKSYSDRAQLSNADRITLDYIKSQIAANSKDIDLRNYRSKLEPLSDIEDDQVQFYLWMITAIDNPSACIKIFNDASSDNYWRTFWVCLAFIKNGQRAEAGKAMHRLSQWDEQSCNNALVLNCMEYVFEEKYDAAAEFLERFSARDVSQWLRPFRKALEAIVARPGKLSGDPETDFYLSRIFEIEDSSRYAASSAFSSFGSAASVNPSAKAVDTAIRNSGLNRPEPRNSKTIIGFVAVAVILAIIISVFSLSRGRVAEKNAGTERNEQVEVQPPVPAVKQPVKSKAATPKIGAATAPSAAPVPDTKPARNENAPIAKDEDNVDVRAANAGHSSVAPVESPIKSLETRAAEGDNDAKYKVGMMYYSGNGVEKNYQKAFEYLKPLADIGYVKAFFPVAEMYHGGRGVPKSRSEAEIWYQKAADKGDAKAERILRNMF